MTSLSLVRWYDQRWRYQRYRAVPVGGTSATRVSHVTPSGTGRTGRPVAHRLDSTAIWLLNLASTRGHRLAQERLAHAHVRRWHYAILATLADTGPSAQADISRQLGVDRGDLVTFLNDLEERGWVSRTP